MRGEPGFAAGPAPGAAGIRAFALGPPGGFWVRLVAYVIDSIVLLGIMAFTVPAFLDMGLWEYIERTGAGQIHPLDTILRVLYATLLVALFATTVGKRAFRLYVVSVDGSRVGFGRALARALGEILSSLLFGIGYLMIAFRADKRGLHDLIAGTVVIRRQ